MTRSCNPGLGCVGVHVAQHAAEGDVAPRADVGVGAPTGGGKGAKRVGEERRLIEDRDTGRLLPGLQEVADLEQHRTVARVVRDRLVDLRVLARRVKPLRGAAAPVNLDCVDAPRHERVYVLLVVPEGSPVRGGAARGAGIGIDAELEAVRMQRGREPGDPMGPLRSTDDDVAGGVALALPPAGIQPDQPVTVALQPGALQLGRLLQDRRLRKTSRQRVGGVPAHVGRGRKQRRRALRPRGADTREQRDASRDGSHARERRAQDRYWPVPPRPRPRPAAVAWR